MATSFPEKVSICPNEFRGIKPKLIVKEGDEVKVGSPLFFDKLKPDIMWPSPVSGKVVSIQIGARRVIEKIEISRIGNETVKFRKFTKKEIEHSDRKTILDHILQANLFPLIRQRPFNKVANPNALPTDIFISGHNSAPLAVNLSSLTEADKELFESGCTVLTK